jgi:hypothetical protein
VEVGGEATDRGGELWWAAACVGDGAAKRTVREPIVHVTPLGREGGLVATDETTAFAPAIVSDACSASSPPSLPEPTIPAETSLSSSCASPGRIEIALLGGSRVIIDNGVDAAALRRVLNVLAQS